MFHPHFIDDSPEPHAGAAGEVEHLSQSLPFRLDKCQPGFKRLLLGIVPQRIELVQVFSFDSFVFLGTCILTAFRSDRPAEESPFPPIFMGLRAFSFWRPHQGTCCVNRRGESPVDNFGCIFYRQYFIRKMADDGVVSQEIVKGGAVRHFPIDHRSNPFN